MLKREGVVAVTVASPCAMPVISPVLGFTLTILSSEEKYSKRSVVVAGTAFASSVMVCSVSKAIFVSVSEAATLSAVTGFSTGMISMPFRRAVTIVPSMAYIFPLETKDFTFASVP